ncbi:MAG: hypothetical protein ACYC3L_01290 [Gemmatimonadaceae bacterium]
MMSDETTTPTLLKGEGETKLVRRTRVRHECGSCGEPATVRYTFLLDNFRRNPASSGYMRDDCTWCSDHEQFACDDPTCRREQKVAPDGMGHVGEMSLSDRFAHLFLTWQETEVSDA